KPSRRLPKPRRLRKPLRSRRPRKRSPSPPHPPRKPGRAARSSPRPGRRAKARKKSRARAAGGSARASSEKGPWRAILTKKPACGPVFSGRASKPASEAVHGGGDIGLAAGIGQAQVAMAFGGVEVEAGRRGDVAFGEQALRKIHA